MESDNWISATNEVLSANDESNPNAIDLTLQQNTKKTIGVLRYKISRTAENKIMLTCSSHAELEKTFDKVFIERSQDGACFYSLDMLYSRNIKDNYFYIDDSSDWYEKLWYRVRIKNIDGTEVISKPLTL